MLRTGPLICLISAAWFSQVAIVQAHFLWLRCEDGKVHVYFSETADPEDPKLLKRLGTVEVWSKSNELGAEEPFAPLKVTLGEDSLEGELPEDVGQILLNHDFGVMNRGNESFALRYYAKTYPHRNSAAWDNSGDPKQLALEITPEWRGRELILKVTWQGKPVVGAQIVVEGVGLDGQEKTTDDHGQVTLTPTEAGLLSVRAKYVENQAGTHAGKAFDSIRHYSTLTVPLELPTVFSIDHSLPRLERGVTSLGAAVLDGYLYLYGGHLGGAHHYSTKQQSNEFRRLSLQHPEQGWEDLPGGPKLTGLALVGYNGKLYRIGGFTATNAEEEDQNLVSQTDFACFDPTTKTWTALPELPLGRSSHDAAVLDGKLYVVGGWRLQGGEKESEWHNVGLVCDLTQPALVWKEFPVPFQRRALSVATHDGRLYVLGGMRKEEGEPTTRVDIYDPATGQWSEGPALVGSTMDGFGVSSFSIGGHLLASTMSGGIQQLSPDGKSWKPVGKLRYPRFFHRLLPADDQRAVVVGGASMQTGKAVELELLSPEQAP